MCGSIRIFIYINPSKKMNRYEIMYLISPKIKDEDLNPLTEQLRTLISKHSGEIKKEDDLGKKKLAYPIKNYRHGFYYVMYFDMPGDKISALEKDLKITEDVLRYLIVRHDEQTWKALEDNKKKAAEKALSAESEKEDKPEEKTAEKKPVEAEPIKKDSKKEKPEPAKEDVKKVTADKKTDDKTTRKAEAKKEKAKLDELDKKLDEILDDEIID